MTKEQEKISSINRQKAWDYFVSIGEIPKDAEPYSFAMHHINPNWKENDVERYIQWNISDLEVMPFGEHSKHHAIGHVCSEATKTKIGNSNKGKRDSHLGDKNGMFGKCHSDETKKKMSEARKAYWKKKKQSCSREEKQNCSENLN